MVFVDGHFVCKFVYNFRPDREQLRKKQPWTPSAGIEPAVPVQRSDHCATCTACSWRALSAFTVELRISTVLKRELNDI